MEVKKIILSLTAACSLLTVVNAKENIDLQNKASNMPEFITEGVVNSEVQYFYLETNKPGDGKPNSYANSLGGYFQYTTSKSHIFYASFKMYASIPMGGGSNRGATGLFTKPEGDALLTSAEAYLAMNTPNGTVKVGNFMLNTPVMNIDPTRIVPWSYRGIGYEDSNIANTKLALYHITEVRDMYSNRYDKESASGDIGDSGITMASVKYTGISNLVLQTYYYYAPDLYDTFFAQADYAYGLSDNNKLRFGIQYFGTLNGGENVGSKTSLMGADDAKLFGARVGYDSSNFDIYLNYSQNFGESGLLKGYGGLTKAYTTSMIANGRRNYKPTAWMLKSNYVLPETSWGKTDLALNLTHVRTDMKAEKSQDFDAIYMHIRNKFNKNDSVYLRYEYIDQKDFTYYDANNIKNAAAAQDFQQFRIIYAHKF
ncbi:hypothetical protein MNB_SV-5-1436 [hydrothermal vent metagenome]|uniref:Outer membrane porin n=1 Tax=hydrothermal vent metagenome TaxID=652676 RepID=A0A1W1EFH5_9ZZZZ